MRRARLLHVLASAPAAVLPTVAPALSPPAVAAASVPPPYVVAIDPGHGGTDPGAIGLDGLVEKDLTLDVSDRLAALLRTDGVTVVLTRTTDASVSIQQRSDTANAAHADVFLPIYFNAWTTPTPEGSVVLYPYSRDIPFAQAISQAVAAYIGPYGGSDGGIVLRDNWWLQPTMPVATVESLFITNPQDAALLTQASFRQGLAVALKSGIESFLPGILQREQQIRAATPPPVAAGVGASATPRSSHPLGGHHGAGEVGGGATTGGGGAATASGGGPPAAVTVLLWMLLVAGVVLAIRHRRRLLPLAAAVVGRAGQLVRATGLHRRALRRRRRLLRERAGAEAGSEARVEPAAGHDLRSLHPGHRPAAWPAADATPEAEVGVRGRRAASYVDRLPL